MTLLPKGFQQIESPLADRSYVVPKVHQAFHHYLKVSVLAPSFLSSHLTTNNQLSFMVAAFV